MHQASTRLMRMTTDGRPFTQDYKDLFSTLIVSLPLSTHRTHFRSHSFSFTTEEALINLRYLKLTHSARSPDAKDPSKIVVTTSTTTFSMAPDVAKSLCQWFILSHFIESVSEKNLTIFKDKAIWKLTPKGITILSRFVKRNGVDISIVNDLLASRYNTMQLVIIERDAKTDMILQDPFMTEVIFRYFIGSKPNFVSSNISDSADDYIDGCVGVRIIEQKYLESSKYCFNGLSAFLWLMRCCTTMTYGEAIDIATIFVNYNLIVRENTDLLSKSDNFKFSSSKNDIYMLTEKGLSISGWNNLDTSLNAPSSKQKFFSIGNGRKKQSNTKNVQFRALQKVDANSSILQKENLYDAAANLLNNETNHKRLFTILKDPALRFQFRVFLQENYCEENLSFYLESIEFFQLAEHATNSVSIHEALTKAYEMYNAFLVEGSPCELNLDYILRQSLADFMTTIILSDEETMKKTLDSVVDLFSKAQKQIFRLMARDSVPKFLQSATQPKNNNQPQKITRPSLSTHPIPQIS
ncbi:uncharacterized protein T551_01456 [Pneumocystis jirovecii RU7]|uniref:RGS domain-containing protein n=1 Tax=Pneumocystis jirovecii (strain RU7) TaxID=1408657 RepID=A0A0W4ZRA1_PNEJ7|nr:uncharacterized protein T551_01456 [Pneumocystis jirovecii RU7]KTW30904.1 hypothetical protein T551_01456 [Pneumocystis jirovecii RU7]